MHIDRVHVPVLESLFGNTAEYYDTASIELVPNQEKNGAAPLVPKRTIAGKKKEQQCRAANEIMALPSA